MVWNVTTDGDLSDNPEHRDHYTSVDAWSDYWGRILELEIHGYVRNGGFRVWFSRGDRAETHHCHYRAALAIIASPLATWHIRRSTDP